MRDLTLSQEYLICAVNEKGTLFTFNTEKLVCLVAAALLELQLEGCAAVDKKFITVTGPLPQEMAHLRPLYDYLNTGKPMQTEKLLEEYTYSVTDAHLNELMAAIGDSLVQQGLMTPVKAGLLGKKQGYLPTREAINAVVDLVRAEPQCAEILAQDLEVEAMSITEAEKKIKAFADSHKIGGFSCVTPAESDRILREFYCLPPRPAGAGGGLEAAGGLGLDLADFWG